MSIRFFRLAMHVFTFSFIVVTLLAPLPAAVASTTSPSIATSSLSVGEVGVAYSQRLSASGGVTPYLWSTDSPLPAGLTLSNDGLLSGTPQSSIDEPFDVSVTDADGSVANASFELEIVPGLSITTTAVPDPVLAVSYSAQLLASGGVAPYTWSVTNGSIPLGLVLNSAGILSGLPAATGTSVTTITVTDGAGGRATIGLSVTVEQSPDVPEAYLVTSPNGAVSTFASPGVSVPQTASSDPGDVVGIGTDAATNRYWLVSATGHVTASPGTRSYGSVGHNDLSGRIVGIAAEANGTGYWLVSSTGRVYGFGSARSLGSVQPQRLSGRIVGIAAEANGTGYWLVSSTGRVYGFGSADVLHRQGKPRPGPSVIGIAADPLSDGYWIVTRAGRVYAYGRSRIEGSVPSNRHLHSVIAIAAAPADGGYWLVTRDGIVFSFGSAASLSGVEVAPGATGVVAIASAA